MSGPAFTDRTTGYLLTIQVRVPLGEAVWRFTTSADENGVTVSRVVAVEREPGREPSA